jgi:HK97 family phage prohead protease
MRVRGYAAVFGNVDSDGEVVDRGAFSGWLKANPDTPVQIYWMHSHKYNPMAKPIGVTTRLKQDRKGLYFEGEIAATDEGREVAELMKSGAISGASFGFRVKDKYQKKEVWHLSDLELLEISAANWGANPKAHIEAMQEKQQETEDEHEQR